MRAMRREPTLNRGDVWGIWTLTVAGVAIAIGALVQGVTRIITVIGNTNVEVPAEFLGTTARAPIGPGGTEVEVELQRAVLTVPSLPAASVAAGVLEAVTMMLATACVVVLVILLCRQLTRGRIFSRHNTRLAFTAGLVWVFGAALVPFFGNMVANGAFARLSDRSFNNVVMSLDLSTLIVAAFGAAFIASVFAVGERLQRDAEGLV